MTRNLFISFSLNRFAKTLAFALVLAALLPGKAWTHGEVAGAGRQDFRFLLEGEGGKYRIELMHSPALPTAGEPTNFELKIFRLLPEPDPLLGSEVPVGLEPEVTVVDRQSGKTVDPHLPLHSEGEAGIYGSEYKFPASGSLLLRFVLPTETGDRLNLEVPVSVNVNFAAVFRLWVRIAVALLILGLTGMQLWKIRAKGGHLEQMLRPLSIGAVSLVLVFLVMDFVILDRVLALREPNVPDGPPETVILNEDGSYTIPESIQKELGIAVAATKQMPLNQALTAVGTVEPRADKMAVVQAPIWGRIEFADQLLAVGDRVKRGQELVRVILELSQFERAPMEAKQRDIKGALQQAKERLEAAQLEYERAQKLFAANPAYEQDLEWAKQLYENAKEIIEEVDRQDKGYVKVIEFRDPRKTPVVSPINGIITSIDFTPGELNLTDEYRQLFTIVDPGQVWVRAVVYVPDVVKLKVGQPALVYPPNHPDRPLRGTIRYMDDAVDPASRTVPLLIDVPNSDEQLAFGSFVQVGFAQRQSGIVVPVEAVVDEGTSRRVYVVREPERFAPVEVELGFQQDGWWQVVAGLEEGDLVISKGAALLGSLRQKEPAPMEGAIVSSSPQIQPSSALRIATEP